MHANVQQLEEFNIDGLAWKMKWNALHLWGMLGVTLLTQEAWRMGPADLDDQAGEDDEDTYHDTLEGCDMRLGELMGRPIRQHAVATIKKVVILSILVHNTNQKVNYLQCMLGIFLQSAHTPQKLMHMIISMLTSKPQIKQAEERMGRTYRDLLELHPESQGRASMSCRLWYNTWKILSDLVEHGPGYFWNFKDLLGELEFVKAIPVVKTLIIAAC
ncbi:hypothetical protein EDD16DRAFT_1516294 [Pisolithus croceorrhizus]|nr:hypothetical protein EV401DRAFT_1890041 [Pisolithus croceorrhizus]KAI6128458.1 hypothetical protein EDD16DRAFT_1516294 [Pisolithus croceorrhizus]